MSLRSRLTLAFFAISVVPLTAVTLFSYASSERALRRAAEQQANQLADELGHRMEFVTADLERRMDRAWPSPPSAAAPGSAERRAAAARGGRQAAPAPVPTPPQAVSAEQVAGHVAGVLGEIAPMLDKIEVLAPPAPGTAGLPTPPAAPSRRVPVAAARAAQRKPGPPSSRRALLPRCRRRSPPRSASTSRRRRPKARRR